MGNSLLAHIPANKFRTLKERNWCFDDHAAAFIRWWEIEKSAAAEHAWTEHHRPAWDVVFILDQARSEDTLCIKEALCITMAEQWMLLNRDWGTNIADYWGLLLQCMHITDR